MSKKVQIAVVNKKKTSVMKGYSVAVIRDGRTDYDIIEIKAETARAALLKAIMRTGHTDIFAVEITCESH